MNVKFEGVTFVFKKEPSDPSILHIFARHLKLPKDAIAVWFGGVHTYNAPHKRFEAEMDGVGIYWYPLDLASDVVMIVSCFDLD